MHGYEKQLHLPSSPERTSTALKLTHKLFIPRNNKAIFQRLSTADSRHHDHDRLRRECLHETGIN